MSLTVKQSVDVAVGRNKEAMAIAARITAGNIINDKLAAIVTPKLPLMARGYAATPVGKAVLANVFASAITHFMPANAKANQASAAMVEAAMLEFVGTFNIEEMVAELLEGVTLPTIPTEEA